MFLPETVRSCMIETDVSSYLQTTSSGQVEKKKPKKQTKRKWWKLIFPQTLTRKHWQPWNEISLVFALTNRERKREINKFLNCCLWWILLHQQLHPTISSIVLRDGVTIFPSDEKRTIFMSHNSKSCVINQNREEIHFTLLCMKLFYVVLYVRINLKNTKLFLVKHRISCTLPQLHETLE